VFALTVEGITRKIEMNSLCQGEESSVDCVDRKIQSLDRKFGSWIESLDRKMKSNWIALC